jgi:RimJ/RimL family protein N-acetyltransferase
MIEGDGIRLRTWREHDLPVLMLIRNDVALQGQLLARVRGSNIEQVRDWLVNRDSQPDKLLFIIADQEKDATLGFMQVNDIELTDKRAELGVCLIHEVQGRGVGRKSLRLICTYLRDTWGLRKISLKVRVDNEIAISCYRRVGFNSCGLLRQHVFINGDWQDVMLMELFLDSFG